MALEKRRSHVLAKPFTMQINERVSIRIYGDSRPHLLEIAALQKGLILMHNGQELIEEGAGFGVPVVKYFDRTYFSRSAEIWVEQEDICCTLIKVFDLDVVARKRLGKHSYVNDDLYRFFRKRFEKAYLSRSRFSFFFNKLMEFRQVAGFQTDFTEVVSKGKVVVKYVVDTGNVIRVFVDFHGLEKAGCREILVLNEQGSTFFDKYCDTDGLELVGEKISGWREVTANEASLSDVAESLKFVLARQKACSLFRGREKTKGRFAWSGLSYSLAPDRNEFCYSIHLKERQES